MSSVIKTDMKWIEKTLTILGPGRALGDAYFTLGPRPQIKAATITNLGAGLLVGNAIKDIRFMSAVFSQRPVLNTAYLRHETSPPKDEPLGYSGSPYVDDYRYVTLLPHEQGLSGGLLVSYPLQSRTDLLTQSVDLPELVYDGRTPLLETAGVPEVIRWNRTGRHDLLLSTAEGHIMRHARLPGDTIGFEPQGQPVLDETGPLQFHGLAHLCVVDWYLRGRSDLLIGTHDGLILLYPDIGDEHQVSFGRAIQLCSSDGGIQLHGGASPAVLATDDTRHLIAADGRGVVHAWQLQKTKSLETRSLPAEWTRPHQLFTPATSRSQAGQFNPAIPELIIDLPASGWHEVHVTFTAAQPGQPLPMVEARLSGDKDYICLSPEPAPGKQLLAAGSDDESRVFFKAADLGNQKLHLRQLVAGFDYQGGWPTWLVSIILIPAEAICHPINERDANPAPAPVPVAAILDTFMWFNHIQCDTSEQMDALMGYHQQAGFNHIYYKLGGGSWEYPSKVPGTQGAIPPMPVYSEEDKHYCAKLNKMLWRVNRVQLAIDACQKRGLPFYAWIRLQNHGEHMHAHARFGLDQFFLDHPQWCELDVHGNVVAGKLCLAWPQVRAYHASIAAEVVAMGARGILIDTLRQLPKVMYGQPVLDKFFDKHGMDMRQLPPFDARVVAMQASVMTDFLLEVRTAIKAVRSDAQLHVRVGSVHALMGCDVGLWAREGLIDTAIIEHRGIAAGAPDVAGLVEVLRGTKCLPMASFARTTWGRERKSMLPQRVAAEVSRWQHEGAQGIAFYETAMAVPNQELCRAIQRINKPAIRFSCQR